MRFQFFFKSYLISPKQWSVKQGKLGIFQFLSVRLEIYQSLTTGLTLEISILCVKLLINFVTSFSFIYKLKEQMIHFIY